MKLLSTTLSILAGLLLFSSFGLAQSALGSIAVAVTDPQGASVAGAKLTVQYMFRLLCVNCSRLVGAQTG